MLSISKIGVIGAVVLIVLYAQIINTKEGDVLTCKVISGYIIQDFYKETC